MAPDAFHYVVIGGGTAGLAVATRLAEGPATSVCVLEAGEDVTQELNIVVPDQSHDFGKSETFAPTAEDISKFQPTVSAAAHGTSGPLQRTLPRYINDLQAPLLQGMNSLGIAFNPDAASGDNTGIWISNHSIDSQGARSSSASTYYETNKSRSNLVVITGAHATEILFNSARDEFGNLVASGVQYRKDGQVHVVVAQEEVILCAGSFQTPQLLELSGIGDKNVLKSHGVDVKLDLPGVGSNLQVLFLSTWRKQTEYKSTDLMRDPVRAAEEWKLYEESRTGVLSVAFSTLFSFLPRGHFVEPSYAIPEQIGTQLHPAMEGIQRDWLGQDEVPLLEVAFRSGFIPTAGHTSQAGKNYCSVFLGLIHPFSSGSVHITSTDPLAAPLIDYNVLDNQVDLDLFVRAIKFARKLVATPSLSPILSEIVPGTEVQTDEEITDYIRGAVETVFHPIGTAAMLPRNKGGVVDPALRVYGTANLRVCDASIIPLQLSAHTQATVYAIAEKAADIIKRERRGN
ncbi:hypothetical protein C8R47DRAFT_1218976 [Mycena vitilis]|nr:hypothetical protein C8R47DRAFT_1218976 [Mycena vitilis]